MLKQRILLLVLLSVLLMCSLRPVFAAQEVKGETLYAEFDTSFPAPPGSPGLLIRIVAMIVGQVWIKDQNIKLPALDGFAQTFYHTSKGVLGPKIISDATVDGSTNPDSHWEITGRLCVYRNNQLIDNIVSQTRYRTVDPDPAKTIEHRQGSEFLAATNINYKLSPRDDDKYHYERVTLNIKKNEPLECDKSLDTDTQTISGKQSEDDNTFLTNPIARAAYNAMRRAAEEAGEILNWDEIRVTYKGTTLNPWTAHTECFYAGCENGADVANVDYDVSDNIKTAGGVANTFRPAIMSIKDKKDGGAQGQEFEYTGGTEDSDTAYSYAGHLKTTADYTFCSLSPLLARQQIFGPLTGGLETDKECKFDVQLTPTPAACGTTELPELNPVSGACALCTNSISGYLDDPNSVPGGQLPPTLVSILNSAAQTFQVPASSILAAMYHEGAFTSRFTGANAWTEENVVKWSVCGGEIPKTICDKTQTSTTQAPFGWIPYWFYNNAGSGSLWTAVQAVDPARNTPALVSPCNVLDAAFATAKALKINTAGVPGALTGIDMCFGFPSNLPSVPQSCGDWNAADC